VAVFEDDAVVAIDAAGMREIARVAVGDGPAGLAIAPDGSRLYVANMLGDSVSVLRTTAPAVLATTPVPTHPVGVASDPRGHQVYAANSFDDSLSVLDADGAVVDTVRVGAGPFSPGAFATATVAVEPAQALRELLAALPGFGWKPGIATSLATPLQRALRDLANAPPGRGSRACTWLAQFTDQVARARGVGPTDAAQLTHDAGAIAQALGCPR
jgi:YVTN family beta-propeller protein